LPLSLPKYAHNLNILGVLYNPCN